VFVEMGEIVNVVGLRGEIKVLVTGNFDEEVLTSEFLRMRRPGGESRPAHCTGFRWKGQTVVMSLREVEGRDGADEARGMLLGFESTDYDAPGFPRGDTLPPFVYHGLEVVTTQGESIGRVDDVLILPANWCLRVVRDGTEEEILVPVIDDFVREVDREAGRVVVEAVPGLFDEA